MPDELTTAIQAAKTRAEENCVRCQREAEFKATGKWHPYVGTYSDVPPTKPDHTCHGDLAAVRDVALAAVKADRELWRYSEDTVDFEAELKDHLLPSSGKGEG